MSSLKSLSLAAATASHEAQDVEFCLGIDYYVAELKVIVTLIVTVSLAVVISLKFTLERRVQELAVAVPPINIPASRIVRLHTSALQKNLSRYATLLV